jgi:hypothetical protein
LFSNKPWAENKIHIFNSIIHTYIHKSSTIGQNRNAVYHYVHHMCTCRDIFFQVCRPASRLHLQTPWSASICQLYLTMDAFNRYSLIILEYSGIFNRLRFRFPQPHYNYNEDEAVSLLHVLVLGRAFASRAILPCKSMVEVDSIGTRLCSEHFRT